MRVPHSNSAFSLVEITLALGIAAFTLISIFGLLPVGLNTSQGAVQQTAASNIALAMIADIRQTQPDQSSSTKYGIPLTSGTTLLLNEGGEVSTTDARFKATITITPPTGSARTATFGSASITWPAAAAPERALGSVKTFFALDRN